MKQETVEGASGAHEMASGFHAPAVTSQVVLARKVERQKREGKPRFLLIAVPGARLYAPGMYESLTTKS